MTDQKAIDISVEDVQNLRRMHRQQYARLTDAYSRQDRPGATAAAREIAEAHYSCADLFDVVEYMLTHWTPPATSGESTGG